MRQSLGWHELAAIFCRSRDDLAAANPAKPLLTLRSQAVRSPPFPGAALRSFEAALGQLGLIERNDLATMAIAKVIIGLAKEGEAVCLSIEADIKVSRPTRNAP